MLNSSLQEFLAELRCLFLLQVFKYFRIRTIEKTAERLWVSQRNIERTNAALILPGHICGAIQHPGDGLKN